MITVSKTSFVIPHKGRMDFLKKTINSIQLLEKGEDELEIIVVTQEDCNYIKQELESLNWSCPVNVLGRPSTHTISALRNDGESECIGEYLAFLDADIELSVDWLVRLKHELGKAQRIIVSAVQDSSSDATSLERLRVALSNRVVDASVEFLPGRNLLMRRCDFHRIGGFPEHLETCEDYYFTSKANKLGELYYSTASTYVHLGEDNNHRELFNKEIWRGKSNFQSLSGRSISLYEIPSFVVPLIVTAGFLFLMLGIYKLSIGIGILGGVFLIPFFIYVLRLRVIEPSQIGLKDALKFYLIYFPARTIGMFHGVFDLLLRRNHD